jgi:hypothetical protein
MRGLVNPMLRWVPWRKPVIGPKAEHLSSPSNPAVTTAEPPPALEAVLRAGITRVVIALEDPDPRVAGGGMAQLRPQGLR